jgi:hypothetical protein
MIPRRVHRPVWSRSSRWLATVALLSLVPGLPSRLRASGATDPEDLRTPLTAIAAIRALTPQVANQGHRVVIRGTITYINEREPAGIIVHDGRVAVFVHYGRAYLRAHPRIELHPGDVIEVQGVTTGEGFAPAVEPDAVRRVGHSELPPAKRVSYATLVSGVFDCEYIEAVGVGQRAWVSESGKTLFVDIAVEGGQVRAWFWDFSPQDLTRFIDARIRLRGSAGTRQPGASGAGRHSSGPHCGCDHRHQRSSAWSLESAPSEPVHPSCDGPTRSPGGWRHRHRTRVGQPGSLKTSRCTRVPRRCGTACPRCDQRRPDRDGTVNRAAPGDVIDIADPGQRRT